MIPRANGLESPVRIDDALRAFIESGVSVVIGTRDEALLPEICRAWGPQVCTDSRSISLCVPQATSLRTRNNLVQNGQIAVAFSLPSNYQTLQLKGRYTGSSETSAGDRLMVDRHREAFARINEALGISRSQVEAFWQRELIHSPVLITLRFLVEQIFDQTPGPGAGRSV